MSQKIRVVIAKPGANALRFELLAVPKLQLDSQPNGATIELAGKPNGSTPITLTPLTPGSMVSIVYTHQG